MYDRECSQSIDEAFIQPWGVTGTILFHTCPQLVWWCSAGRWPHSLPLAPLLPSTLVPDPRARLAHGSSLEVLPRTWESLLGRCLLQDAGLWQEVELGSIVSAAWTCRFRRVPCCGEALNGTGLGPILWSSKRFLFYSVGIKYLLPVLTGVWHGLDFYQGKNPQPKTPNIPQAERFIIWWVD